MRLLLDTHALLWWIADDQRMPSSLDRYILDPSTRVYISAASAWEVATKHRLGKLPGVARIAGSVAAAIAEETFHQLPVTVAHGQLAGSLPGPHEDPFDRMLIAQALLEDLTLVSNEALFDRYGVTRLW